MHGVSRYGGEKRSRELRNAAARLTRHIVDSLQALGDDSRIIVMGDLNDDPINESVEKYLKTSGSKKNIPEGYLYNPMYEMHKSGIGSLAYRDNWNLFDQIIISSEYLNKDQATLKFHSAKVFNDEFLKVQDGRYKGYPKRTFVGNTFQGGYSDHFPVYILLYR